MKSWSQAFSEFLAQNEIQQQKCSFDLRIAPSAIHNWVHGGRPRDEKIRKRIERWSDGAVPFDLPKEPVRDHGSGPQLSDTSRPSSARRAG